MKDVEKLNITRSRELFEEATTLVPGGVLGARNRAILSKENTRSFLNPARAAD